MIGGRFFVRGSASHHTVFYLAGLGDRILRASPRAAGPLALRGKKRGIIALVVLVMGVVVIIIFVVVVSYFTCLEGSGRLDLLYFTCLEG